MTINDHIRDEKLQYDVNREAAKISALSSYDVNREAAKISALSSYDVNREAAKISALSSGKIDKYKYLLVKKYNHLINSR